MNLKNKLLLSLVCYIGSYKALPFVIPPIVNLIVSVLPSTLSYLILALFETFIVLFYFPITFMRHFFTVMPESNPLCFGLVISALWATTPLVYLVISVFLRQGKADESER